MSKTRRVSNRLPGRTAGVFARLVLAVAAMLVGVRDSTALASAPSTSDPQEALYRVKCAYLKNLIRFTTWPDDAFDNASASFVISVLDSEGHVASRMSDYLNGQTTTSGRPISVLRHSGVSDDIVDSHILYVTQSAENMLTTIRAKLTTHPVLLVGEAPDFARQGGMIALYPTHDALQCDLNLARAERAGLKLSGRLASVVRLVRDSLSD